MLKTNKIFLNCSIILCMSIFVILSMVYKLENGKNGVRNDRCAYFFLSKLPLVQMFYWKKWLYHLSWGCLFVSEKPTFIKLMFVCLFLKKKSKKFNKNYKNFEYFFIYDFCVKEFGCQTKAQLILQHSSLKILKSSQNLNWCPDVFWKNIILRLIKVHNIGG